MRLLPLVLGIAIALGPLTASAGVHVGIAIGVPPPLVVPAPSPLVVVPGVPAVQYAPSLGADVFLYSGFYWRWWNGAWFEGPGWGGPWVHVIRPPAPVLAVPYRYWHRPPRYVGPRWHPGHGWPAHHWDEHGYHHGRAHGHGHHHGG